MKTAFAIAALAAIATAAAQDPMAEISAHWDALTSIINHDLPTLKLAQPELYAQATEIIGGTEITQPFSPELVQQVATGIDTGLMNAVLHEAGITDITLDGKPIPTGAPAPTTSADKSSDPASTPAPTSGASSDASSRPQESSKPASSDASSKDKSESESDSKPEESESDDESTEETDTGSGAAKNMIAGSLAAVVAIAALF